MQRALKRKSFAARRIIRSCTLMTCMYSNASVSHRESYRGQPPVCRANVDRHSLDIRSTYDRHTSNIRADVDRHSLCIFLRVLINIHDTSIIESEGSGWKGQQQNGRWRRHSVGRPRPTYQYPSSIHQRSINQSINIRLIIKTVRPQTAGLSFTQFVIFVAHIP